MYKITTNPGVFQTSFMKDLGSIKGRSVPSQMMGGTVNLWTLAEPVGSNLWVQGNHSTGRSPKAASRPVDIFRSHCLLGAVGKKSH